MRNFAIEKDYLILNKIKMKKYILIALLGLGMIGSTGSIAQEGPKTEKKDTKAEKKDRKVVKKEYRGSERKAEKKKEKAITYPSRNLEALALFKLSF